MIYKLKDRQIIFRILHVLHPKYSSSDFINQFG